MARRPSTQNFLDLLRETTATIQMALWSAEGPEISELSEATLHLHHTTVAMISSNWACVQNSEAYLPVWFHDAYVATLALRNWAQYGVSYHTGDAIRVIREVDHLISDYDVTHGHAAYCEEMMKWSLRGIRISMFRRMWLWLVRHACSCG